MALVNIVLFAALLAIGAADLVIFSPCDESNDDICKISEVRINPCHRGNVCILKQDSNASMAFDFTPYFSASNMKTMVWWTSAIGEIMFPGFGSDNACDYTSCPFVAGQSQTIINHKVYDGRMLPKGNFNFKGKLWNPDNESQICCFKIKIEVV